MWHIALDKPAPVYPLCGAPLENGVAILRVSEYDAQLDPWDVFGDVVCDACAREAAKVDNAQD